MPRAIQKGMQNVKEKPANVNHVLFTHRICWNIEFHCFFYMMTIANLDQLSYFIEVNWNRWQKCQFSQGSDCLFSLLQDVHLGVASTSGNLQHFPAEALFGGRIINQPCFVIHQDLMLKCKILQFIPYFDHLLPDSNVQQWRHVSARWNETKLMSLLDCLLWKLPFFVLWQFFRWNETKFMSLLVEDCLLGSPRFLLSSFRWNETKLISLLILDCFKDHCRKTTRLRTRVLRGHTKTDGYVPKPFHHIALVVRALNLNLSQT